MKIKIRGVSLRMRGMDAILEAVRDGRDCTIRIRKNSKGEIIDVVMEKKLKF